MCNWQPQIAFADGVRQTVTWYQENLAWLERVRERNNAFFGQSIAPGPGVSAFRLFDRSSVYS